MSHRTRSTVSVRPAEASARSSSRFMTGDRIHSCIPLATGAGARVREAPRDGDVQPARVLLDLVAEVGPLDELVARERHVPAPGVAVAQVGGEAPRPGG